MWCGWKMPESQAGCTPFPVPMFVRQWEGRAVSCTLTHSAGVSVLLLVSGLWVLRMPPPTPMTLPGALVVTPVYLWLHLHHLSNS